MQLVIFTCEICKDDKMLTKTKCILVVTLGILCPLICEQAFTIPKNNGVCAC